MNNEQGQSMTSAEFHLRVLLFVMHSQNADVEPVQLPHVDRECPNARCGARDAVYFQSQQRTAETGMVSIMVR